MKLTENVLKQTIREVISELLDEGKPEPVKGPKEAAEFLKTVTDAAKEADKYPRENPTKNKKVASPARKEMKEDIDEVSGVPVAEDEFDPLAASEALDKVAGVDDVKALDVGPVNEEDLDLEEQETPDPKLPKVPDVKTEVPAAEKGLPPRAPAGQQTTTPLSLKEQASAKHNRIFESLVKSITKK